jgi:hypothetical protein
MDGEKQQNGQLVYTPKSLADGKTFYYRVSPPESLVRGNLHEWFSAKIRALQDQLGEPLENWNIKREKDDHLGVAH